MLKSERVRFVFLIIFFFFSALIQIFGVASIAPFTTLLTNPEIIQTNKIFATIYNYFQFTDTKLFIEVVALGSMLMMILSNAIAVFTLWLTMRFSITIGNSLQCRLYENLLFRPYLYHKSINHSVSISTINQQAPRFVYMVLQPLLLFTSNVFLGLIILIGLLFLNPGISLGIGFVIGGAYFLTYHFIKRLLKKHGDVLTVRNVEVQKILTEGFIGIKEVTLNKLHRNFIEKYRNINLKGLNSSSILTLVGDIPKYVIETIAFSTIFIGAIIALQFDNNSSSIIVFLSIYA
ncbi:MAG: ABC transporter ATP-binding protein, partial [Fibrobacter sp.]|nr:ABC transporter ATP-binding protein [Fibrobacter sp.]